MLQLIGRRLFFIFLVCLLIILFVHMGMRMIRNSEVSEPDYDMVNYARLAWEDTQATLQMDMVGAGVARSRSRASL